MHLLVSHCAMFRVPLPGLLLTSTGCIQRPLSVCWAIRILERFAKRDDSGNVLEEIRPELKDYQSSKLIALLGVTDAQLTEFSVDMSVRDIKKKVKELHGEAQDKTQGEPQDKTVEADTSNGKAIIDTMAQEVNFQTLVTFHNMEEYNKYLDGLNDLIEKALKSKNFEADHKRIEIIVKW